MGCIVCCPCRVAGLLKPLNPDSSVLEYSGFSIFLVEIKHHLLENKPQDDSGNSVGLYLTVGFAPFAPLPMSSLGTQPWDVEASVPRMLGWRLPLQNGKGLYLNGIP